MPLASHRLARETAGTILNQQSAPGSCVNPAEALDTTTAQGRLVFHMFGALAEFERSLIRERTQAGLAAARRLGRTGGRPPKLTEDDLDVARALLANTDIAVTPSTRTLG